MCPCYRLLGFLITSPALALTMCLLAWDFSLDESSREKIVSLIAGAGLLTVTQASTHEKPR